MRRKLYDRACEVCGGVFHPEKHSQKLCSKACAGRLHTQHTTEQISCAGCGGSVRKGKARIALYSLHYCSLECRLASGQRSAEERKRQKKAAKKAAKPKKQADPWFDRLNVLVDRATDRGEGNEWERAIQNRLLQRPKPKDRHNKPIPADWWGAVLDAMERIALRRKWASLNQWERKIVNKLSNLKKRRRVKHEKEETSNSESVVRTTGTIQLCLCFDWLEADAGDVLD